jgi:hypothetical protein
MTVEFQEGILSIADAIASALSTGGMQIQVMLDTNTTPKTEASVFADLVQPTYTGYAAQNFGVAPIGITSFDGTNDRSILSNATTMVWTVTASGAPNNITGVAFVLMNPLTFTNTVLVYVPISPYLVMQNAGDTFSFTPSLYFKHGD